MNIISGFSGSPNNALHSLVKYLINHSGRHGAHDRVLNCLSHKFNTYSNVTGERRVTGNKFHRHVTHSAKTWFGDETKWWSMIP